MESLLLEITPVFQWLIKTTLQASVIICIVLAVKILLSKKLTPRWHYVLWMLVIARMVMPVSLQSSYSIYNLVSRFNTISVSSPDHNTENSFDSTLEENTASSLEQEEVEVSSSETDVLAVETPGTVTDTVDVAVADVESTSKDISNPEVERSKPVIIETSVPPSGKNGYPVWEVAFILIPYVWLVGATILGIYVLISNLKLWRIIRVQRPVTDSKILNLLEDCKTQMNMHAYLAVVETDKVTSPALFGFLRPRLLLPQGMMYKLSREQLRHIFLHELAHLKRGDIYFGWITALLQTLHWFNPLVWYGFHKMRADRELACDELAIKAMKDGENNEYGKTIVSLLEDFSAPQYTPGLAGILEEKSQLKRRISMIANHRKGSPRLSVFAAVLMMVIGGVALTDGLAVSSVVISPASVNELPAEIQPMAEVIVKWFNGCRENNVEKVRDTFHPDKKSVVSQKTLKEMNEILSFNYNWKFELLSVMWDDNEAMAVSKVFIKNDFRIGKDFSLIWPLKKNEQGSWMLLGFGGEELEGMQLENALFLKDHPDAKIWCKAPWYHKPKKDDLKGTDAFSTGEEKKLDKWVKKICSLKGHKPAAFSVMPQLLREEDPDFALEVAKTVWPKITDSKLKTGILKAFHFADHKHDLQVQDMGVHDNDPYVVSYALTYVTEYSVIEFPGLCDEYEQWYQANKDKSPEKIIAESKCSRFDELDKEIENLVREFETPKEVTGGDLWDHAGKLGEAKYVYAIPTMIGIIDADNSYDTIYGVGYFGLGRITGVRYSPFHDGPWWHRWWQKNIANYPKKVQDTLIPELKKTEHGKKYVPMPEEVETIDGMLAWTLENYDSLMQKGNYIDWDKVAEELAERNDPKAIPYLIAALGASNNKLSYDVCYHGLDRLTGVKYENGLTYEWFRQWWDKNMQKYPQEVQGIDIDKIIEIYSGKSSQAIDPNAKYHIVVPGETLFSIAEKYYGDGKYWNIIFKANRDEVLDVDKFRTGMKLLIPELEIMPAEKEDHNIQNSVAKQGRLSDQKTKKDNAKLSDTYIIEFKPVAPFSAGNSRELLDAFNKNHPKKVRTHHYRTSRKDNCLIGKIHVDTESGKDAVIKMLNDSDKLELVSEARASRENVDKLTSSSRRNARQFEETYIVEFKPVESFKPGSTSELLNAFNKNHPQGVWTHHYRTRRGDGCIIGKMHIETESGKDAIVKMLNDSDKLEMVSVVKADQDYIDILNDSSREISAEPKDTYIIEFKALASVCNDYPNGLIGMLKDGLYEELSLYNYSAHVDGIFETGVIHVDTEKGKEILVDSINKSEKLQLVKVKQASMNHLKKLNGADKSVKPVSSVIENSDDELHDDMFIYPPLDKNVSVDIDHSPKNTKLSVQYGIIAICKAAGVGYDWDTSSKLADPERGKYIPPIHFTNKNAHKAINEIITPIGLSYGIKDGKLYLYRVK